MIKKDLQSLSGLFLFIVISLFSGLSIGLGLQYHRVTKQYEKLKMMKQTYKRYVHAYQCAFIKKYGGQGEHGNPFFLSHIIQKKVFSPSFLPYSVQVLGTNRVPNAKKTGATQTHTPEFLWPLNHSDYWLSSKFGSRKKSNSAQEFHYGIDLASPKGTPVKASEEGVVVEAVYSQKGYGNTIVIAHNDGYQTRYAHLDDICVNAGQAVERGKKIGCVGVSGNVRGERGKKSASHLHFEVKKNGKHLDPLLVLK